jgi:uncharacterized membrane protein
MKRNQIYDLVLTAVFISIIMLMSLIPQIGFVTILPGVSVTLVHIPVLIGIFLLPRNYAIILGLFFGIGSLIAAWLYGVNPIDLAFRNPLISIIPRILFAVAAYYIFKGLKLIENKFKNGVTVIYGLVVLITIFSVYYGSQAISGFTGWSFSVIAPIALLLITGFLTVYFSFVNKNRNNDILIPSSFILGTLSHTILVLTAIAVVKPSLYGAGADILGIIYSIAVTNGLIEALVAVLVGTPIIIALNQLQKNR